MIKAGVGCSTDKNATVAAREAASEALANAGISRADWGLLFITFPHRQSYGEILKSVADALGTRNIAGCSTLGVIAGNREIEAEPAAAVLAVSSDAISATSFLVPDSGDGGLQAGVGIANRHIPRNSPNSLIALFPDPFRIHSEFLFRGIESRLGDAPIVGGAASEHPYFDQTFQFTGEGGVSSGSVSGLILDGAFSHKIGVTQGCQPVGPPCVITKADGNIIFELDGLPAFDVLKSKIPSSLLDDPNELLSLIFAGFPLNRSDEKIAGGDYLVRNLIGLNPASGIIGVAENVREGQIMTFALRNPAMAREDLKLMLGRMTASQTAPPAFGFYFNCCGRGSSLYGHTGIDTAYITNAIGDAPLIGFFGNSEFAPLGGENRVFTYTGALVMIYG